MTSAADLPDDIDALKAIILASQAKMTEQDGIIERKEDRKHPARTAAMRP